MIFVDSNVAIDALDPDSPFHGWAQDRLADALDGGVFFNHIVVAELAARAISVEELQRMLDLLRIPVEPLTDEVAFRAGQAFKAWIRNGGRRGALLPDFVIGAHASVNGARVLTRDPRRFRSYFPELDLILPEPTND
ncbi:DNA-binding protein [Novosphingobium endophyticum]|uniref:Ribonuclease VapC n=1 Tax=Novosphingobium endophyticum TaxID=1955250 RepID=A0A916TRP6_9SPHN|nr:type II toxin-antitoxin system VapC family toxin [Novosphingobium endophyticum]GGB97301.1 DNA-binding protein [Novosphingobium endophyticum]